MKIVLELTSSVYSCFATFAIVLILKLLYAVVLTTTQVIIFWFDESTCYSKAKPVFLKLNLE